MRQDRNDVRRPYQKITYSQTIRETLNEVPWPSEFRSCFANSARKILSDFGPTLLTKQE
jgi:hypothetical protein